MARSLSLFPGNTSGHRSRSPELPHPVSTEQIRRSLDMSNSATPVIENSEPNFRKGSIPAVRLWISE
jgi:hypothetical protein